MRLSFQCHPNRPVVSHTRSTRMPCAHNSTAYNVCTIDHSRLGVLRFFREERRQLKFYCHRHWPSVDHTHAARPLVRRETLARVMVSLLSGGRGREHRHVRASRPCRAQRRRAAWPTLGGGAHVRMALVISRWGKPRRSRAHWSRGPAGCRTGDLQNATGTEHRGTLKSSRLPPPFLHRQLVRKQRALNNSPVAGRALDLWNQ